MSAVNYYNVLAVAAHTKAYAWYQMNSGKYFYNLTWFSVFGDSQRDGLNSLPQSFKVCIDWDPGEDDIYWG